MHYFTKKVFFPSRKGFVLPVSPLQNFVGCVHDYGISKVKIRTTEFSVSLIWFSKLILWSEVEKMGHWRGELIFAKYDITDIEYHIFWSLDLFSILFRTVSKLRPQVRENWVKFWMLENIVGNIEDWGEKIVIARYLAIISFFYIKF